jgi:hypothetical protein
MSVALKIVAAGCFIILLGGLVAPKSLMSFCAVL